MRNCKGSDTDNDGDFFDEEACPGESLSEHDVEFCKEFERSCPYWEDWSEWSQCPVTCGGGTRYKYRQCMRDGRDVDLTECKSGIHKIGESCNDRACGEKMHYWFNQISSGAEYDPDLDNYNLDYWEAVHDS